MLAQECECVHVCMMLRCIYVYVLCASPLQCALVQTYEHAHAGVLWSLLWFTCKCLHECACTLHSGSHVYAYVLVMHLLEYFGACSDFHVNVCVKMHGCNQKYMLVLCMHSCTHVRMHKWVCLESLHMMDIHVCIDLHVCTWMCTGMWMPWHLNINACMHAQGWGISARVSGVQAFDYAFLYKSMCVCQFLILMHAVYMGVIRTKCRYWTFTHIYAWMWVNWVYTHDVYINAHISVHMCVKVHRRALALGCVSTCMHVRMRMWVCLKSPHMHCIYYARVGVCVCTWMCFRTACTYVYVSVSQASVHDIDVCILCTCGFACMYVDVG